MRVQRRSGRVQRSAFTLVELLMVIAIIAILAALTLAGVQRVTVVGKTTKTRSDMSQLGTAIEHFKLMRGEYPPQSIKFPSSATTTDPEEQQALKLLARLFRGYDPSVAIPFRGIADMRGTTRLTGSQSLVFFLGGPDLTGFQANKPLAPASVSTSAIAPEFTFPLTRLVNDTSSPYYSAYLDPFGVPYAYFSCGVGQSYPVSNAATPAATFPSIYWAIPDRPGMSLTAFQESTGKFANPRTFQIISAGPDGLFGSNVGGTATVPTNVPWTPNQGDYGQSAPGQDDLSNFYDNPLGTAK